MVEVFKTSVRDSRSASIVVNLIHNMFPGYRANFDLDDCDKILRIHSYHRTIDAADIIRTLATLGYLAEILPDILTKSVDDSAVTIPDSPTAVRT